MFIFFFLKLQLTFQTNCENEASPVSWAVHGLESEGLFLDIKGEHVLTVVLPVA